MRKGTYALTLLILLSAVACVQQQVVQLPNETVEEPPVIIVEPPETEIFEKPNPDILVLTARAGRVTGYSFTLAKLPGTTGGDEVFVHGVRARVKPVTPVPVEGWSADYLYLDYEKQSAIAYCIELSSCKSERRKASLPFTSYAVPLPPQWIPSALYGEKAGSAQLNNRPVTIVKWNSEEHYYRAYMDNYYGFPQRVEIADDEKMVNITGGFDYQNMAFATTEEDVTPPY